MRNACMSCSRSIGAISYQNGASYPNVVPADNPACDIRDMTSRVELHITGDVSDRNFDVGVRRDGAVQFLSSVNVFA